MMHVIKRTDQGGGYLCPAGSAKAYTHNIRKARIFHSREEADADRCKGNEIVLSVDSQLGGC